MRDLLISELDLFLLLLHRDLPSLDEIPTNTQLVTLWFLSTTTIHATPSSNPPGTTLYAVNTEPDLVLAKSIVWSSLSRSSFWWKTHKRMIDSSFIVSCCCDPHCILSLAYAFSQFPATQHKKQPMILTKRIEWMNVSIRCDFCVSQKLITTPSHCALGWEEYKRQREEASTVLSRNLTIMAGVTGGPCRSSSPKSLTYSKSFNIRKINNWRCPWCILGGFRLLFFRLPSWYVSRRLSKYDSHLADLKHFRCNRVYVPWLNKGNRRTNSLWNLNRALFQ